MPKIYSRYVDNCTVNAQLNKIGLMAERDDVSEYWIVRDHKGNKWALPDSEIWSFIQTKINARQDMAYFNGELETEDKPVTGIKWK